jgi:hypothetical protein
MENRFVQLIPAVTSNGNGAEATTGRDYFHHPPRAERSLPVVNPVLLVHTWMTDCLE